MSATNTFTTHMESVFSFRSACRILTFLLFAFLNARVNAQTYYIKPSGNDALNGTSVATAWKTLDRIRTEYPLGVPTGVTVRLERNGTYVGQVDIRSGAQNVTINAYGTGAKPIVYGSIPIASSDWMTDVDGKRYTTITSSLTPWYLFDGSIRKTLARYPNVDVGWIRNASCTTVGATSVITATPSVPLPPAANMMNAQLVARTYNWQYQFSKVTSVTTGAVCTPAVRSMETYDWGFFFQGTLPLIDSDGEWCFVEATQRVYYRSGTPTPPTSVRIAVHPFGVNITGGNPITDNILIQNIRFMHQTQAGVALRGDGVGAHHVSVLDCEFKDMYRGIDDRNTTPLPGTNTFMRNRFEDIYNVAVRSVGNATTISQNHLERIGLDPSAGRSLDPSTQFGGFGLYTGMSVGGDGYVVKENVLRDIGYAGINATGKGAIAKNRIHNALAILNDGGGIQFDHTTGLTIEDNIITDLGEPANLESTAKSKPISGGSLTYHAHRPITYGIYFGDKYIRNAVVQRNTISGCDIGIHVDHSKCSENAKILYNTLFNNRAQLSMSDYSNWTDDRPNNPTVPCYGTGDQGGQGAGGTNYIASYNDTYAGNITYCLNSAQRCVEQSHIWASSWANRVKYGTFTDNHWFNPFNDAPFRLNTKYPGSEGRPFSMAIGSKQWSDLNKEFGALYSPLSVPDHSVLSNDPPAFSVDFTGAGPFNDWGNCTWQTPPLPGTRTIDVIGGNNALRTTNGPWVERVACATGPLAPVPGTYRINFKLATQDATALVAGYHENSAQGQVGGRSFVAGPGALKTYSMIVDVTDPEGDDWMYFDITDGQYGSGYRTSNATIIDDVVVNKCILDPAFTNQIALDHILRYNNPLADGLTDPQDVNSSFTLAAGTCWADVDGRIYSGTVTLAPWQSIVLYKVNGTFAIQPPVGSTIYEITANTTWNTDMNVKGSIVVKENVTLTIDGARIGFAVTTPQLTTNIEVKPGGTLIVQNNALLTTALNCEGQGMWDGIQVYSSRNGLNVIKEGKVFLTTGATISDAHVGVALGKAAEPPLVPAKIGGRIQADNAYFKNNRNGVVATHTAIDYFAYTAGSTIPAGHLAYEPQFTRCTFHTTTPLHVPSLTPLAHVKLLGRKRAMFRGCTFSNQQLSHTSSNAMGHGIEAFNSSFSVLKTTGANPVGNSFRNLDHGIHTTQSLGAWATLIEGNSFTDNICGVFASGAISSFIQSNNFQLGRWSSVTMDHIDEDLWGGYHRAIFTTGSYASGIRDNVITRTPGTLPTFGVEGIVVGYTRGHNDVVWRNEATDINRAFVGEGISADVTGGNAMSVGLQMHCNVNHGNEINLISRKANTLNTVEQSQHTIRGNQGSASQSAGNRFDQLAANTDYGKNTTNLPVINYFHSGANSNTNIDRPRYVDAGITRIPNATANPCLYPPGTEGSGSSSAMVQQRLLDERTAYGNVRYLYDELIDGGSTDEVVQEITDAWPNEVWELRSSLLSKSPYLSVRC